MSPEPKKECPSCAMEIAESSETCPVCGYEFPRGSKVPGWVIIALLFLLAIVVASQLVRFF